MNKLKLISGLLFLLVLLLVLANQDSKRDNFAMDMPDTKSSFFAIEKGLSSDSKKEKVVFEKYTRSMIRTAKVERIYANGDYYKINIFFSSSTKKEELFWKKIGTISQRGIKKIQKISNTSVIDFILAEPDPNHIGDSAMDNIDWYFYFDQPKFAETQVIILKWQWWVQPRFVKQMDRTLWWHLTPEYEEPILPGSAREVEEACD